MDIFGLMMDFIVRHVLSANLIIVVILWFFGWVIKHHTTILKRRIPLILMFLGVIYGMIRVGPSLEGFEQGVMCAALAVFLHESTKGGGPTWERFFEMIKNGTQNGE